MAILWIFLLCFLSSPVGFLHGSVGDPLSNGDTISGIPNCLHWNLCWSVDLSVHTALARSAWPQPCLYFLAWQLLGQPRSLWRL